MRSLFFLLLVSCASTSGMSGPSMSGKVAADEEAVPEIQSNDILARDMRTSKAQVKHILIGWRDLDKKRMHPRAAARSRADADALAVLVLQRVRAGEDLEALMREFSEDQGSAEAGKAYEVTVDAGLVFEFKRLSLRLDVGEAGLVRTQFGWHIIKRIE